MGRSASGQDRARRPWILVLDQIDEGLSERQFELSPGDLDLGDSPYAFRGPLAVALTVGRTRQVFSVAGTVTWAIEGECCRCLAAAGAALRAEVSVLLQRLEGSSAQVAAIAAAQAEEEMLGLLDPGLKEVDLRDHVRDAVVLELPLRVFCRPDCKGLCPHCGQDLNAGPCACARRQVDPRWEGLARLRTQG